MELRIANLNTLVLKDELTSIFAEYGNVVSTRIIKDRFTASLNNIGIVIMENKQDAFKAIQALDGSDLREDKIEITTLKYS